MDAPVSCFAKLKSKEKKPEESGARCWIEKLSIKYEQYYQPAWQVSTGGGKKGQGRGEWGKETLWILLPFLCCTFPPLLSPSLPLPSLPFPPFVCACHTGYNVMHANQGPVPERPINANPTELNNVCACAETGEVWDLNQYRLPKDFQDIPTFWRFLIWILNI